MTSRRRAARSLPSARSNTADCRASPARLRCSSLSEIRGVPYPIGESLRREFSVVAKEVGEAEYLERAPGAFGDVQDKHVTSVGFELAVRFEQYRDASRVDERELRAVDEQVG